MKFRLSVHETLDSTSSFCLARAAAGEPGGLAVLALAQPAGRGSRGRAWSMLPGNLALSVLLRPPMPVLAPGAWPLLAGIAACEALRAAAPDPGAVTLKWPNDLLLRGAKAGGILIDAAGDAVVIGFGVNLAAAPVIEGQRTAHLGDLYPGELGGAVPPPQTFARSVLDQLGVWLGRVAGGEGIVYREWSARAHPPGTPLRVRYAGQELAGRFAGLAPDGRLVLATEQGARLISAGEVLLARG